MFLGIVLGAGSPAILSSYRPEFLHKAILGAIGGGLGASILASGVACLKRSRRLTALSAEQRLAEDPRAPVLFLRSFKDDKKTSRSPNSLTLSTFTIEEQLRDVFDSVGPMVAIGRPGEDLPGLGAARTYADEREWQTRVQAMMSRSRLVVLLAGESEGFWWEVSAAFRTLNPERLVFLIPFGNKQYAHFCQRANHYFPHPLPSYREKWAPFWRLRGIVYFEPDWTPRLVKLNDGYFRGSWRDPVAASLRLAMRPVLSQLHCECPEVRPLPFRWEKVFSLVFILLVAGAILFRVATRGAELEREVLEIPPYRALKTADPQSFERMMDVLRTSAPRPGSRQATVAKARQVLIPLIPHYIARASDESVSLYMETQLEEIGALLSRSDSLCYAFLNPQAGATLDPSSYIDADLRQRDLETLAKVIQSASESPQSPPTPSQYGEALELVSNQMRAEHGDDLGLLARLGDPSVDKGKACRLIISLFEKALALSPERRGPLLRYLLSARP